MQKKQLNNISFVYLNNDRYICIVIYSFILREIIELVC